MTTTTWTLATSASPDPATVPVAPCPSCGDALLPGGPAVCAACAEDGACTICAGSHRPTRCPEIVRERTRQERQEAVGRGVALAMRHDRARFLATVARVGDSDRRAMANALAGYLAAQTQLFQSPPLSAERILADWAAQKGSHEDRH